MIKSFIRKWLGINSILDVQQIFNSLYEIEIKKEREAMQIIIEHEARKNFLVCNETDKKMSIVKIKIENLEQKFDAFCDILGIEIVEDCVREQRQAYIVSTRENSLLEHSKEYIEAALTAEKIISLQHRTLEKNMELLQSITWRKNKA